MAETKYQNSPGAIRDPAYGPNPAVLKGAPVSQGTVAKPVPIVLGRFTQKLPTPGVVNAPGASGTI